MTLKRLPVLLLGLLIVETYAARAHAAWARIPGVMCEGGPNVFSTDTSSGVVSYARTYAFDSALVYDQYGGFGNLDITCPVTDGSSLSRTGINSITFHVLDASSATSSNGAVSARACIEDPYNSYNWNCGTMSYSFGTGTYNQYTSGATNAQTGFTAMNVDPYSFALSYGSYWYWGAYIEASVTPEGAVMQYYISSTSP